MDTIATIDDYVNQFKVLCVKPEMEKAFEPRVQSTAFLRLLLFSGFQKLWSFRPDESSPDEKQHSTTRLIRDAFS